MKINETNWKIVFNNNIVTCTNTSDHIMIEIDIDFYHAKIYDNKNFPDDYKHISMEHLEELLPNIRDIDDHVELVGEVINIIASNEQETVINYINKIIEEINNDDDKGVRNGCKQSNHERAHMHDVCSFCKKGHIL